MAHPDRFGHRGSELRSLPPEGNYTPRGYIRQVGIQDAKGLAHGDHTGESDSLQAVLPKGSRFVGVNVSLLYFDGCPNHDTTLTLLQRLLADARWEGDIQLVNVESRERAEELGFRGSPTILIDGIDPFLDTDAPVGLSCRIYATDEGYQGTPPETELRAAIRRSIAT